MKKLSQRITPGPWTFETQDSWYRILSPKNLSIAETDWNSSSKEVSMERGKQNAIAISAVPEMLGLLEKISECRFPYQYQDVKKEIVEFLNKLNK